jgi:cation diffusion facilitator family transporter
MREGDSVLVDSDTMNSSLLRLASISILVSLVVIGLKVLAWAWTGSVGLLSDAAESLANVVGALVAYLMLSLAVEPPDDEHTYGHSKAEYFASGFEGGLILVAALGIAWAGVARWLSPKPLEDLGVGLLLGGGASLLNLGLARVLLRSGRAHGSITLEASGRHLMTDVWTSVGVLGAVAGVAWTGWQWLDPLAALVVSVHILWTGWGLLHRSALGLLDTSLPAESLAKIRGVLAEYEARGIQFHALRTRTAGHRSFVSLHVLVPGAWSVQRGHDLAEELEARIRAQVRGAVVFTHLEPLEDPVSFLDAQFPT